MKSSFELAMEKFGGGPLIKLPPEAKKEIAEIDSKMNAKLAEAELAKDKRMHEALGDVMLREQILKDYAVEIASVKSDFERKKDEIRQKYTSDKG